MLGGYYLGQLYLGISGLPSAGELSVVQSSHQLSSDNVTLTQKHAILVDSTIHSLSSANVTLTQKHLLTVENAIHTLMSENVAITSEQVLGINNAFHGVTSTEIALTQKHSIVVNNTAHTVTSENLDLVEHKLLVVQNTTHTHTADGNLAIVVHFYLVVGNALHGHTVQSVALTQKHSISVANALHGLSSTAIGGLLSIEPFGFGGGFGAIDGWGVKQFGEINIELPLNFLILGLDSYHSLFDTLTAITQKHELVTNDSTISVTSKTLELWQTMFRHSGIYIKEFEDAGAVGSEYAADAGTVPRNSGYFGQITPDADTENGFFVTEIGSNGSYSIDDINNGNFIGRNRSHGNLTTDTKDSGNYIKSKNNSGEYEVI